MSQLTVHRELAKHFARHARLYRGAFAALASQVVLVPLAWVFGPAWLALAGALLAFSAGLAWPLPSQEPRARAEIRTQIGYVYDTALSAGETDDYGFRSDVQKEARYRERAVLPPELPQWWVPLLLCAVLLSAVPFVRTVRAPALPTHAAKVQPQQPETGEEEPPTEPEHPADAIDPREPDAPPPPEGQTATGVPQESRAAIDDFLADLDYAPDDAPLSDEIGELGEALEQYEQLADDTAYTELEASPGDELAEEPDDSVDGGVAEVTEPDEEEIDGSVVTTETGMGDGEIGEEAGTQEIDTGNEHGLSAGDEDDPGGAGDGDGTPRYQDNNERLSGVESDPEFLGGITDGTMERSGSVRVEGADDAHRVRGRALSAYEEAIEEELLGGSLPVPYQDTVRKFFQ